MTREDKAVTSKKEMQYYLAHGKEFGSMQAPLFADMWRLFSKVFDHFESRTCESCKYLGDKFEGKYSRQQWNCNQQIGFDICTYTNEPFVIPTFGCIEWESK